MTRRVVDVHSHLYPRWYLDRLARRRTPPRVVTGDDGERLVMSGGDAPGSGRPLTPGFWDLQAKLTYMDAAGIDQTLLSLGNPWFEPFSAREGLRATIRLNAEFAHLEGDTLGRILGLGCLPPGPIEAVVEVIGSIAASPGLYGSISGTRIAGRELDDPALEPVWDRLAETELPLLIHPHRGVGQPLPRMLQVAIGFPVEITVAAGRVLSGGVIDRHPGIRLGFTHGGGALPYLLGRLDAATRSRQGDATGARPGVLVRRLFFDALVLSGASLRLLVDRVGAERVAFGTDHPFGIGDTVTPDDLSAALDADAVDAVAGGSATRFFGLPTV